MSIIIPSKTTNLSTLVTTETAFGQSATAGVATTASKGDHTHGTPAAPAAGFTSQSNPSRSLNATFQNTSGKTMFVTVATSNRQTVSPGNDAYTQAKTDAGNPPSTIVGFGGHIADNNTVANDYIYASISFMVLNNNFYRVESVTGANGVVSLASWTEWT